MNHEEHSEPLGISAILNAHYYYYYYYYMYTEHRQCIIINRKYILEAAYEICSIKIVLHKSSEIKQSTIHNII